MKLIIDIDDHEYTEIKEDAEIFRNKDMIVPHLYKVIESGIPLPKGHGRIGDLDELHHTFKEICNAYSINNLSFMSDMDMNFDLAPIIIEADKAGDTE